MKEVLYGVSPTDPLTFIAVAVVLLSRRRHRVPDAGTTRHDGEPNHCSARQLRRDFSNLTNKLNL